MISVKVLEANMPKKYKAGTNIVFLDPDVAKVFKTPASVNKAQNPWLKLLKLKKA